MKKNKVHMMGETSGDWCGFGNLPGPFKSHPLLTRDPSLVTCVYCKKSLAKFGTPMEYR